jgi:hypothetical protein
MKNLTNHKYFGKMIISKASMDFRMKLMLFSLPSLK